MPDIFKVEIEDQGLRLDKFLVTKLPSLSRSRLQELIEEGFVKVDQKNAEASSKVKEGQLIEVTIPPLVDAHPAPQNIPLDILYEDNDVVVINKSAGMVVHPAPGNPEGTLVNALLSHCGDSLSGINGVKRPGIVHRLDKETSGLLVAAKNDKAHHHLAHQLANHTMGRRYLAIVWGMVMPLEGTIEGAIGRDPRHRQRMAVRQSGKFARTHYKVLKLYGRVASLVECRLETGRTHQIRVHLAAKGHSLVGDALYGKPPKSIPLVLQTYLKENWRKDRHALHAKELLFMHPTTNENLHFSTELPEDIRNLIDVLNLLGHNDT
ncbi:MAG TPA: RluA family pseudouridine synthase [Alphaproteobacteria bacterium]|nr:RluA family pseudouridine synthase [Alphaproteobacteria bacterium]